MVKFTSDFSQESERTTVALLYGRPKVGKTRALLEIVREDKDAFLLLISTDRGSKQHLMRDSKVFDGRVALVEPAGLAEMREAVTEVGSKVEKLLKSGVQRSKIWIVVDTLTHLQIRLLQEARKIDLRAPKTEDFDDDKFVRDFQTEVDWGINLTLMSEQADRLSGFGVNLVYTALEKTEKPKGQTEKSSPSLSGQSRDRFMGDVDLILHMVQTDEGARVFMTDYRGGGGDRTGQLDPVEPANMLAVFNKIFRPKDVVSQAKGSNVNNEGETSHGNQAQA